MVEQNRVKQNKTAIIMNEQYHCMNFFVYLQRNLFLFIIIARYKFKDRKWAAWIAEGLFLRMWLFWCMEITTTVRTVILKRVCVIQIS